MYRAFAFNCIFSLQKSVKSSGFTGAEAGSEAEEVFTDFFVLFDSDILSTINIQKVTLLSHHIHGELYMFPPTHKLYRLERLLLVKSRDMV